jgi:hypothetical protein
MSAAAEEAREAVTIGVAKAVSDGEAAPMKEGEDAEEESATQFQASAPVTAAALHCIHAMAVNRDRRASLLEHGALLVVLRTSVFFACASEEDEVVPTAAAALAALGNTQICAQHHSLPLLAVATAAAKTGQGEEFAPSTSKQSGRRDPALWSLLGAVLTPALLDVLCRSPAQFATLARAASSRGAWRWSGGERWSGCGRAHC